MSLLPKIRSSSAVLIVAIQAMVICGCAPALKSPETTSSMNITNPALRDYQFLANMYRDDYFPDFLVDKCGEILIEFCLEIERQKPTTDQELFTLSHAATNRINELTDDFMENDSELETGAREALGADFAFIVSTYGFNVDIEEVIATRDW